MDFLPNRPMYNQISEMGSQLVDISLDPRRSVLERDVAELSLGLTCLLDESVEEDRNYMRHIYTTALSVLGIANEESLIAIQSEFKQKIRNDAKQLAPGCGTNMRTWRSLDICSFAMQRIHMTTDTALSLAKRAWEFGIRDGVTAADSDQLEIGSRHDVDQPCNPIQLVPHRDQQTIEQDFEVGPPPPPYAHTFAVVNDAQVDHIQIHKGATENRVHGWDFCLLSENAVSKLPNGEYTVHNRQKCQYYENSGTAIHRYGGAVRVFP